MIDHNIKRHGLIMVISAPSGVGKTTLARMLLESDEHIHHSVSYTTRPKRSNEVEGIHYHFVGVDRFKEMIENNDFLEYVELFGHLYGTPKQSVSTLLAAGEDVLFEIDWQGHRQILSRARQDMVSVFILPPCKEELFKRLSGRNQDSKEVMHRRLEEANWELCHWHEYDYVIINRCLEDSLDKLHSILRAERLKKERRTGLPEFVESLIQQDINFLLKNLINSDESNNNLLG